MTEDSAHLELYKKYRPTKWAGLVGQGKVAQSLRNAVLAEKLPTGYLFSGPRGCGKTSAALLLAKAVNCEQLQEDGNPCNRCETCRSIDNGTQLGVTYTSMGNFGSADDVRELVKKARLSQPVKKQVWILDEVHNLHAKGWDALLIPLEEKTMPSLFILCTTEIDKVPDTIKSRVQARRFTLVDSPRMNAYLKKVAAVEKLEVSDELLEAAVRDGKGSVRDTLTALDTILATGESSQSFGGQLLEALSTRSVEEVLRVTAAAQGASVDFRDFTEQLFEDLRDLLLLAAGADRSLVGIPPLADEEGVVKKLLGPRGVTATLHEVGAALTLMAQGGADSRILLEVALLKTLSTLKKLEAALRQA